MSYSRVVLIGVDGLGGSYLQNLEDRLPDVMPHLCRMLEPHTPPHTHPSLSARTVFPPVSAPAWTSVLTGAPVHAHGVDRNTWPDAKHDLPPFPPFPAGDGVGVGGARPQTLVDRLAAAGHRSLVAASWKWLPRLFRGAANATLLADADGDDERCTRATCAALASHAFVFLHLDLVDHAGHAHGWGGEEYTRAVQKADAMIGRVAKAAVDTGEAVLLVVCSDHGGRGREHRRMTQSDMLVPLVLWGTKGGAAQRREEVEEVEEETPLTVLDIAPTILHAFGVRAPRWMPGVPRAVTADMTR